MLLQRVLTALLLAPFAIALIVLLPTGALALAIGALFLLAWWEWTQLAGITSTTERGGVLLVSAVVFALLWWLRDGVLWPVLAGVGVAWWLLVCQWLRHFAFAAAPTRENRWLKLLAGALVIFPAWSSALLIHGGALGDAWWPPATGHWWVLLALLIVWAADIGAYFSGRYFGKRKLAPTISPGKTWAGVYGAFVAGAALAGLGGWLLGVHGAALLGLIVLAVFTVAASVVGDLLESLLKRHAGVKDSGTLFPGHGGLLDRMDSVFAALPVFALGKLLLGL